MSSLLPPATYYCRTAAVLRRCGVRKACVLGHSYGTLVAARFNTLYRSAVHSLALLDPVCIAMFMPNLLASFLYT